MINNAIEKFRINYESSNRYAIYYKMISKAGKPIHYFYTVTDNGRGVFYSPERRISETAYNFAKPFGVMI